MCTLSRTELTDRSLGIAFVMFYLICRPAFPLPFLLLFLLASPFCVFLALSPLLMVLSLLCTCIVPFQTLDLSSNRLSSLPNTIATCNRMRTLNLNFNKFSYDQSFFHPFLFRCYCIWWLLIPLLLSSLVTSLQWPCLLLLMFTIYMLTKIRVCMR